MPPILQLLLVYPHLAVAHMEVLLQEIVLEEYFRDIIAVSVRNTHTLTTHQLPVELLSPVQVLRVSQQQVIQLEVSLRWVLYVVLTSLLPETNTLTLRVLQQLRVLVSPVHLLEMDQQQVIQLGVFLH